MGTRISTDLSALHLLKLLEAEASERGTTIEDVLSRALEAYFAEPLETKTPRKLADSAFGEWDDPRDADYDRL